MDEDIALNKVEKCIEDVCKWMAEFCLKLNDDRICLHWSGMQSQSG